MGDSQRHWLVGVLRSSEPPACPDEVSIPADATVSEAWQAARSGCSIPSAEVARAVAAAFRLEVADLERAEKTAARFVSAEIARRWTVFPLRDDYRELVVATGDPTNFDAEQEISFASGRNVRFEVADPDSIGEAVKRTYAPDRLVEALVDGVELAAIDEVSVVHDDVVESLSEAEAETQPVIRLVNVILRDAVASGASDVHLEPMEKGGVVRFRVDGLLRHFMQMPDVAMIRVISRLKVMAEMDIADRLRPQDGRVRIEVAGQRYDLRLSTVPTRGSEKAVIRILDTEGAPALEQLGLLEPEHQRFLQLLNHREGIVLVTGPTGSGKTTTLYSALRELAQEDVNIMTVEDPVEYELAGVTQIQVSANQNVTFASALRAILRQDPDIILVGEIRDLETAEMAVQASMTGHLVLATLHTNDAAGTVRRLLDIGLTSSSVADSLRGAVAQRLVRRVCPECAEAVEGSDLTDEEAAFVERTGVRPEVRAVGCDHCAGSGYRGRQPVTEVLIVDDAVTEAIAQERGTSAIREAAVRGGMRLLAETGSELARDGRTTAEEVERVLGELLRAAEGSEGDSAGRSGGGSGEPTRTHASSPAATPAAAPADPGVGDRDVAATVAARPRVLIVDDDATTRVVVKGLLEKEGFFVHELGDGTDAVTLLKTDPVWSLVVLDLDMPLLDGRDVLRILRSSPSTRTLPVVVLTGTPDADAEQEVLEIGADDYVRKPIEAARLLGRVRATLRRSAVYSAGG